MSPETPKVQTKHPQRGKAMPRIDRVTYDAFRAAILRAVPAAGAGLPFQDLPAKVSSLLPKAVRASVGSVSWYTTTVKLDLEARGLIERVAGAKPQRLRRRG